MAYFLCATYARWFGDGMNLVGTAALYAMHVRQHERVGPAVRDAEPRAEGMRQRVIHAHRRVGKRQRRDAGGIVHHAARFFIAADAHRRWAGT